MLFMIVPISTSKAAEDESPLPIGISDEANMSSPLIFTPPSENPAAIPRIRAAVVPFSSSWMARSSVLTMHCGHCSEENLIIPLSLGAATAIISIFTAAARTHPF